MPFLNQRKEKRKYITRPGIEPRTPDLRVRCPADCEANTVKHHCLEHLWNHENMFETEVVRANECKSYHHVRKHNRDIFSIVYNTKVCSVISLESLRRGDSNEYI